jgi:DNA-binding NarL/FixJ family response regulator
MAGLATGNAPIVRITPRETEIAELVCLGLGNKDIATKLRISEKTVKFHTTNIFDKHFVTSRAQFMAIEIRRLRAQLGKN